MYILVYCHLGQGLLSVRMGGPPLYVLTKDKSVCMVISRRTYTLKDKSVHIVLLAIRTVRKVKF